MRKAHRDPNAVAPHLGSYSRGFLPHIDQPELSQFVTFRLGDSLPSSLLAEWKLELKPSPQNQVEAELRRRTAEYIDRGAGECHLAIAECAEAVVNCLRYRDNIDYHLHAYVVMPNHVHVLATLTSRLGLAEVVRAWKGITARAINEHLGRMGQVWAREYFDRFIRDAAQFNEVVKYIGQNSVSTGLCECAEEWPYSSAYDETCVRRPNA